MANECCNTCAKCPHGQIIPDPDPFDWFCDDDEKIYCKILGRDIAGALRPYETDKYVAPNQLCPLRHWENKAQLSCAFFFVIQLYKKCNHVIY